MRIRTVQIGVTDACNLACAMCTREATFRESPGRAPGMMTEELFEKALHDLSTSNFDIDLLFLAWLGESFLHPRLLDFAAAAAAANERAPFFRWLSINTNGTLLPAATRERWVSLARRHGASTRLHLSLSLDAWTDATHRRVKRSGSAETVRRDVEALLAANATDPAFTFNLTFLVLEENEHEAVDFVAGWSRILRRLGLRFRATHDDVAADPGENLLILKRAVLADQPSSDARHLAACRRAGLLPDAPPAAGARVVRAESISKNFADETVFKPQPRRPPCPALFHYPVIHWDGRVTLCCKDTRLDLVVGDLRESSFREIWLEGAAVARHRRLHLEGAFHLEPVCALCGNYDAEGIDEAELAAALAEGGQPELLAAWRARREAADPAPSPRLADGADPGTVARMEAFAAARPLLLPELGKAARTYESLGMPAEASRARAIEAREFPRHLAALVAAGRAPEARALALGRFSGALNARFDAAVREHRTLPDDARETPLAALPGLDLAAFAAETLPGVNAAAPDALPAEELARRHRELLGKFALRRDIGNFHWRRGDHAEALGHFEARLAEDAGDVPALKQAAFCAYHLGEPDRALRFAARALAAGPDFEMERLAGHVRLEGSRFGEAASSFRAALALAPGDFLCAKGLAAALSASGDTVAARDALLRALELAPDAGEREALRGRLARPANGRGAGAGAPGAPGGRHARRP